MSRRRHAVSRKRSKKLFRRTASPASHRKNRSVTVRRGGYRL